MCTFSGVLRLTLSWTLLDVPLSFTSSRLVDVGALLRDQMVSLCTDHKETTRLSTRQCVEEILGDVQRKLEFHCGSDINDRSDNDENYLHNNKCVILQVNLNL